MLQPSLSSGSAVLSGFQPLCPAVPVGVARPCTGDAPFAEMMSDLGDDSPAPTEPAANLSSAVLAAGLIAGVAPMPVQIEPAPAAAAPWSNTDDESETAATDLIAEEQDTPREQSRSGASWIAVDADAADFSRPQGEWETGTRRPAVAPTRTPLPDGREFPANVASETPAIPRRPAAVESDATNRTPPAAEPAQLVGDGALPVAIRSLSATTTVSLASTPEVLAAGASASDRSARFPASEFVAVPSPVIATTDAEFASGVADAMWEESAIPESTPASPSAGGTMFTRSAVSALEIPAPKTAAVHVSSSPGVEFPTAVSRPLPAVAGPTTQPDVFLRSSLPTAAAASLSAEASDVTGNRGESDPARLAPALAEDTAQLALAPDRSRRDATRGAASTAGVAPSGLAKFAGLFRSNSGGSDGDVRDILKKILDSEGEGVASSEGGVGTGVAIPRPVMSYAATLPAPAIAAHGEFVASDLAASAGSTASPELRAAADLSFSAPASTAAQAVEAVLDAAHVAAEARRGSVELKFEVGGNELQVRVDVRQDDVQATFRTESPELRQALAREWDSVATAAAAAERGVRLLPPIFSAPSSHSDSGQGSAYAFAGGDASAGQRDARARRGESPRASGGSRAVGATGAGASASAPASAAPGPRVALPTSRHLHLFA